MQPSIVILNGECAGSVSALPAKEFSIGRDEAADLSLTDPLVALRHCRISPDGNSYCIEDYGRLNRTAVNGKSITGSHALKHGDQIRIGDTRLVFLGPADADAGTLEPYDDGPIGSSEVTVLPPTSTLRRTLADAANVLRNTRDPVQVRENLLSLLLSISPASGAAVLIDESLFTRCRSTSGDSLLVNRALLNRALKDGVPILWNRPPKSIICVPLEAFGHRRGAIYVESSTSESRLDYTHLNLFTGVAAIAALGYEFAATVEHFEAERERLEEALDCHHDLIGDSPAMAELERFIGKVSGSDSTVLIEGESGTGKELVARAIHRNSKRSQRIFVPINCAALPENLLESQLFGYEKGAFTGAVQQHKGEMEVASGGTLFLDEVGEMPLSTQAKLLRAIETREIKRVGGTRPIVVDFRLIAATNRDLKAAAGKNEFREDLYYRLNVLTVRTPALREHPEDIPALARYFVMKYSREKGRLVRGITPQAQNILVQHAWPGNVRELRNVIERAIVLGSTDMIVPEDLPTELLASGAIGPFQLRDNVKASKRELIGKVLILAEGDYKRAAAIAGMHPNAMHRIINRLELTHLLKNSRSKTSAE
jgi:two-component system, NtrC family, response regulator HydG